jgi:hypothetical protein
MAQFCLELYSAGLYTEEEKKAALFSVSSIFKALASMQTDSLGRGIVIYFPTVAFEG